MKKSDLFGTKTPFDTGSGTAFLFSLEKLQKAGLGNISSFPYCLKVLLESVLRNCDDHLVRQEDVVSLAKWQAGRPSSTEFPFKPARVLLQDFTGVPALVDLAAMRSAMFRLGGKPERIEPLIPCDLVIDHSVQVDVYGQSDALTRNMDMEFKRNRERYEFLKWGQNAFERFQVIPPGVGIIHQVNLEFLARTVFVAHIGNTQIAYPDSLVGTDSHTVMINGLGIVGWGVGGIEAEAVMLGQPIFLRQPEVVGFRLSGEMPPQATATDLALTVTQMLRKKGVVGKFVEFYGPGVEKMSLPDRATVANMGPEYGATLGYFPIDDETLNYLQRTGRSEQSIQLVERYAKEQGLFRSKDMPEPEYSDTISLDLDSVKPSVAGPKRPQDRYDLAALQSAFQNSLRTPFERGGFGLDDRSSGKKASVNLTDESSATLSHGAVVIAAITSCTNTSNPSVMLAAGLLAQKAVERGLSVPAYVKTSLAPGSRVVTEYLDRAGLTPYLNELGFYTVGYGCTTCIGNSGPLNEKVSQAIEEHGIVAAAVLSGNRNFEGRINPLTKANYLASPPLVIAYALAGTVDIDLLQDPLGTDRNGDPVYLKEIWPTVDSIINTMDRASNPETFKRLYGDIDSINPRWAEIPAQHGALYNWQTDSTYIQEPPFFLHLEPEPESISPIHGARVLVFLGDSVTTDHISPAGAIPSDSPAARYLQERGITPEAFNTYGSRRGNDRIMVRGTFGNIRLKNRLVGGVEGGWTLLLPDDRRMPIYDAAQEYGQRNTPLIVIAGREYGTGSSRDWAAKGTALLGIKAVLARSYERIHRSNLVGMGVLPLQFLDGESAEKLGLDGRESYTIHIDDDLSSGQRVLIEADSPNGDRKRFNVDVRLDTPVEVEYYRHGGILHTVLRNMLTE